MADPPRSRARGRLALELTIVILGVLIALAADSWWEGRQATQRVQSYVNAVITDMSTARDSLAVSLSQSREVAELYSAILDWALSDEPYPAAGFTGNNRFPAVGVPMGMLEALLTTGDINLIGDERLRTTIVREYSTLSSAVRGIDLQQAALLQNAADFRRITARSPGVTIFPNARQMAQLARTDPEFTAVVATLLSGARAWVSFQEDMLSSVEEILRAAQLTDDYP